MGEAELAAQVLKMVRTWIHPEVYCQTAGERAICRTTMHQIMRLVYDHDNAEEPTDVD